MRSVFDVERDLRNAKTPKKREFFRKVLLALEVYEDKAILNEKAFVDKHIKVFLKRIKDYPTEYGYKEELKALRAKRRWIKYILGPKIKKIKPSISGESGPMECDGEPDYINLKIKDNDNRKSHKSK